MVKLSGGKAVVESLRAEKVTTVFGLIGSATMEIFDALYDSKSIEFIGVHDERTGTHMADGYARAANRPGIMLAGQNGPGVTNLVTGVAQARAAFSPVITIAGALSTEHVYRDAFQEVDQQALFAPITKKTWTVTQTKRIPEMIREAFRAATTPRTGPVHLNLPRDILANVTEFAPFQSPDQYRVNNLPAGSSEDIKQAAKLILNSEKPVIIAGGGIKATDSQLAVKELVQYLCVPVVSSAGHGDAYPHGYPLSAGQMGPRGNPVATQLVRDADVIIALGTRLGFNSTFYSSEYINEKSKIIQVEIEPSQIGRFFPVAVGIHGDAKTVTQQLYSAMAQNQTRCRTSQWVEDFKKNRTRYLLQRDQSVNDAGDSIQPSAVFKQLRKVLPQNTAVTLDAGTLCLQATDALNYWMPRSLFTPLDFGLVGFSFACGLGVKLAFPNRPVVSLMGDGGFGMTLSEISTAVDHKIATVTIVLNNRCWGAEKAYQRDFYGGRYIGSDVSSPPFDEIAKLYGAVGYRVSHISEFSDAVSDALKQNLPAVIDVSVDPDALYSFRKDSFRHRVKI